MGKNEVKTEIQKLKFLENEKSFLMEKDELEFCKFLSQTPFISSLFFLFFMYKCSFIIC